MWHAATPRLVVASSIAGRSSTIREAVWIISIAQAGASAASVGPPRASAVNSVIIGRMRLPGVSRASANASLTAPVPGVALNTMSASVAFDDRSKLVDPAIRNIAEIHSPSYRRKSLASFTVGVPSWISAFSDLWVFEATMDRQPPGQKRAPAERRKPDSALAVGNDLSACGPAAPDGAFPRRPRRPLRRVTLG